MPDGFWVALILLSIFAVYTVAKVVSYMRQSDRQWQQADKSKLRSWEDDDD
jgi:hypothetical protein